MKKHLAGWSIALLTLAGFSLSFSQVQAASLTDGQIQAIIALVRSFGGSADVLQNVEDSLYGRTPSSSSNTTASRSCVTFSRNFGIGSTGDDVSQLQSLLGQQKGDKGIFDESTASLVVDFQKNYGINQTGYVGPATRAQLNVLGCSEGLSDARVRARDARRVADIKQLQLALELFYDAKGSYPASLSELGTSIISVVPKDPTGNQYSYKALLEGCSSSGKKCTNYHIGASLEGSDAQSLKGDSDSDTSGLVGGFSGADTQPCGGKGAGYCFDITGYVGPVLIPPVPSVSEPYVTVSNASALLGAPIPNSSGLTVGYYYTMAFTLSNKGTSAVYLSNMGRGTDITAVLTPDASSVSYSRDASPISLSGDMSGVSLIIPAGSTRTLRFSGQLQSEGQTGQVSYQITSLIYGASASNPTGYSVTSGLSSLKISANFGSGSSKPTLTVLSPNGGETIQVGSVYAIKWLGKNVGKNIAINLSDQTAGPRYGTQYAVRDGTKVFGNDQRDGESEGFMYFNWTVPSTIPAGSNYKLYVGDATPNSASSGLTDESNGYFTITSASSVSRRDTITSYYRELLLREPDTAGLNYWDNGNTSLDAIKSGIIASYEYGVKQQIHALYQELLGRTAEKEGLAYWYDKMYLYQWSISQVRQGVQDSQEYRNKNQSKSGITILSPNGGESIEAGKGYIIMWNAQNVDQVRLFLVSQTGVETPIAPFMAASLGRYSWLVPPGIASGSYKIKLDGPAIGDTSDSYFTIVASAVATPTLSVVLKSTTEDRAGVWGTFKAGGGNQNKSSDDWNLTATLSVPASKTIKSVKMDHSVVNEHWSTDNATDYPLVVVEDGTQLNYSSGQTLVAEGSQTFRLFGQKETTTSYGFKVTVTFTDGTSVSANAQ